VGRPCAGSNFPIHAARAADLTGQHLEAGSMIRSNSVRSLSLLVVAGILSTIGTTLPACSDADEPQYGEIAAEQGAPGAGGGYAAPGRGALGVGAAPPADSGTGTDSGIDAAPGAGGALPDSGPGSTVPMPNIDPWKQSAPSVAARAFFQRGVRWEHRYRAANSVSGNAYVKQTVPTFGSWVPLPSISGAKSGPTLSMVGFGSTDPSYRLCAFIVGSDSTVYVSYAPNFNSNAGTWSSWTALPMTGLPNGVTSAVSASVDEASLTLQLWARGTDGFPYQILARTDAITKGYRFYGQWQRPIAPSGDPYAGDQLATAPTSVYKGSQGYYLFGLNSLGHPIAWINNGGGYVFSELANAMSNAALSADLRYLGTTPVLEVWMRKANDNALVLYRPNVNACATTPSCFDWKGEVTVGPALTSAPSAASSLECAEVEALGLQNPPQYGFVRICGPMNPGPWNWRDARPTP
jgi:hypothetical protein